MSFVKGRLITLLYLRLIITSRVPPASGASITRVPQTLAELNAAYAEPPAGLNGADQVLQAVKDLDISTNDWKRLPWLSTVPLPEIGKPLPRDLNKAMAEFVRRNQTPLWELRFGVMKRCRYPADYGQSAETMLPHLSKIRTGTEFLAICAASQADAGQATEAVQSVTTSFYLAESLKEEPCLVSQKIRCVAIVSVTKILEQVLNRTSPAIEALETLQASLAPLEDAAGTGFGTGLIGDKLMAPTIFNLDQEKLFDLLRQCLDSMRPSVTLELSPAQYPKAADKEFTPGIYDEIIPFLSQQYPQRLTSIVSNCVARAQTAQTNRFFVGFVECKRVAEGIATDAHRVASVRMAITAVALERFRLEHAGKFPESLDQLRPRYLKQKPVDPQEGKEMTYEVQGGSCSLQISSGPDVSPQMRAFRLGVSRSRK